MFGRNHRITKLTVLLPLAALAAVIAVAIFTGVIPSGWPGGSVANAQIQSDQLDENCTVSILNRTVRVRADGSWELPNVPAGAGRVRARATCIRDGITLSGQSELFTISANRMNAIVPFTLGGADPIPLSITVTAPSRILISEGETTQLTVTANFSDGTTTNVTAESDGTNSNSDVVSVSRTGEVTALASGTVVISAIFEGVLGLIQIRVVLGGDSDGDGITDDLELANGLDPRNPVDGLEDPDVDGLTNQDELVNVGSDIRNPDTDGDGLLDGDEVLGNLGFFTSALLPDSDGDGIRDGLEIASGSDPTDPASFNLAGALDSIEVTPTGFALSVDPTVGEASQQLTVTGHLSDGFDIDLTSSGRGTTYTSNNLIICNFGAQAGLIFAGIDGVCTITVANSGFTFIAAGVVRSFAPFGITSIAIPGYANNVDVVDDEFAYVAAGSAGLQIVNVAGVLNGPNLPTGRIVGSLDTPGTAIDIKVVGGLAYIADGEAGLHIADVTDPTKPVTLGTVDTPGTAQDLVVAGDRVYLADGIGGLQIIDVSDPGSPRILGTADTQRIAKGVDVSGNLAVVAADSLFLVIDVTDASTPQVVGSLSVRNLKDVVVRGSVAYVAAYTSGFLAVDFSTPENPTTLSSIQGSGRRGFVPRDVALSGRNALAAEQLFPNVVTITDIGDPAAIRFRDTLDLADLGDYAGTGIALTEQFVYVTEENFVVRVDFKADGDTRLFIGQYEGEGGGDRVAPTVSISSPAAGITLTENTSVSSGGEKIIGDTTIIVTVEANDNEGVSSVQLLVDGLVVNTDASAPYEFTITVPAGSSGVEILALASDTSGNVGSSGSQQVVIVPDTPPTLVITAPAEGATVNKGATLAMAAEVTDNGEIVSVTFSVDGVTINELSGPPYAAGYSVPGTSTAQAQSSSGALPHVIVGGATINGVLAPEGTVIEAWLEDETGADLIIEVVAVDDVGQTATETRLVAVQQRTKVGEAAVTGGSFLLLIKQPLGSSYAGKTLSFTVDGSDVNTKIGWVQGEGTELSLNLVR